MELRLLNNRWACITLFEVCLDGDLMMVEGLLITMVNSMEISENHFQKTTFLIAGFGVQPGKSGRGRLPPFRYGFV